MRRHLTLLAVLLAALPASAQPLHGHPQKTVYATPDEYPTASGQCHWMDAQSAMIMHTHVDGTMAMYGEESEPFVVGFTLKLFHVAGVANLRAAVWNGATNGGIPATDWVWDATGTSTAPALIGDPAGLKIWTGHFTAHPSSETTEVKHGWNAVMMSSETFFTDGAMTRQETFIPFYSTVDPTAAEYPSKPTLTSMCAAASATSGAHYGAAVVQSEEMFPLLPLSVPWRQNLLVYGYQVVGLPEATTTEVADLDLHNGIAGRTLLTAHPTDTSPLVPVAFDPAALGPGAHKVAFIRTQPNGPELQASLLVLDVAVDPNAPPPTFCDAGSHLEGGLCVPDALPPPPPPSPVPTEFWGDVTVHFQRLTDANGLPQNRWRLCSAAGECFEIVMR